MRILRRARWRGPFWIAVLVPAVGRGEQRQPDQQIAIGRVVWIDHVGCAAEIVAPAMQCIAWPPELLLSPAIDKVKRGLIAEAGGRKHDDGLPLGI